MPRRQDMIARSVAHSILHSEDERNGLFAKTTAFFWIYYLNFNCVHEDLFKSLRGMWEIKDEEYKTSFRDSDQRSASLTAMGDMGYSGSTFFRTENAAYLVKSVPRTFEHSFFKDDLLIPYAEHMQKEPHSLLIRITDFLECAQWSIGTLLGTAPSHHIVMENILYGENGDNRDGHEKVWESWDLKPMSYFFPERDVAGGKLASEATKSKLADEFGDKLVLTLDEAESLKMQLAKDTDLLSKVNAVDYSLFLVRIPCSDSSGPGSNEGNAPTQTPMVSSEQSWRTGVKSADGRYYYRAAILDFFWAKHKVHAKAMTGLINTYNVVDRQGPMSVTAKPPEYRKRFLKMCSDMLEEHKNHQYRDPKSFRRGK